MGSVQSCCSSSSEQELGRIDQKAWSEQELDRIAPNTSPEQELEVHLEARKFSQNASSEQELEVQLEARKFSQNASPEQELEVEPEARKRRCRTGRNFNTWPEAREAVFAWAERRAESECEPRQQLLSNPVPPQSLIPRNYVMISARFDKQDNVEYVKMLSERLTRIGIRNIFVNTVKDFGVATDSCLLRARIMLALCTSTYGQKTTGTYETYMELKYAREHPQDVTLVPVKLHSTYPPEPPGPEEGRIQNKVCFSPSLIYIDGIEETSNGAFCKVNPEQLAAKVAQHIHDLGLWSDVVDFDDRMAAAAQQRHDDADLSVLHPALHRQAAAQQRHDDGTLMNHVYFQRGRRR